MRFTKSDAEKLVELKRKMKDLRAEHDRLSKKARELLLETGKPVRRAGHKFALLECKSPKWKAAFLEACGEEAAERVVEDAPTSYRLHVGV